MATRIIHFGRDECKRIPVLRSAGYSVKLCSSLPVLDSVLQSAEKPDAITVSDTAPGDCHDAVLVVHAQCSAPLILFESAFYLPDESEFDLVIRTYTPPHLWLEKIAATIERTCALTADAKSIREQSAALLKELKAIRKKSLTQREHSRLIRSPGKIIEIPK